MTWNWHRWGEPLAAVLNLSYTIGYQLNAGWSFAAGGIGSAVFLFICWQRQMKAEALLWIYYVGMALYGALAVQDTWPNPLPVAAPAEHLLSIGAGLFVWGISCLQMH